MENQGFQNDETQSEDAEQTPEEDNESQRSQSSHDGEIEPERVSESGKSDGEIEPERVSESGKSDGEIEPERVSESGTSDGEIEPERVSESGKSDHGLSTLQPNPPSKDDHTYDETDSVRPHELPDNQVPKESLETGNGHLPPDKKLVNSKSKGRKEVSNKSKKQANGSKPPTDIMEIETGTSLSKKKTKAGTKPFFIFLVVVLSLGIVLVVICGIIFGGSTDDPLLEKYTYDNAAVAADHQTCSKIGRDILQKGGSAADAGIAAMLCVGLVNCHSTGIGGGHFSIFYNRTEGSVISVNAREKAPRDAYRDMFVDTYNASTYGGLAIAVPGELKGFYALHQQAGRLPWRDLIRPSIDLAMYGFPIGGALAGAMRRYEDIILNDESLRDVFVNKNTNELLKENDTLTLLKLADTLQTIADSGNPDPFYTGELAKVIAEEIQERDGIITPDDLAEYTAEVEESALTIKLDGMTMYSPRPPASGAVASYILNILDGYNFSPTSVSSGKSGLTYHRITEAFKFAFARRAELGDDDYEDVEAIVQYLISEDSADETRKRITDEETHEPEYYGGGEFTFKEDGGTTHVSVIDAEGNALALSSTINLYFGSKVRGTKTGIFYNNEMDDFSTPNTTNYFGVPASPTNFIKPGKRPMSSMVPIVVTNENGDVRLVTGGAGGTTITTSASLLVMHSLWFGDNVREALERRRIHHQLYPPYVEFEEGIDDEIKKGLANRNHDVEGTSSLAVIQLVTKEGNKIYARSDPRKSGHGAAGY